MGRHVDPFQPGGPLREESVGTSRESLAFLQLRQTLPILPWACLPFLGEEPILKGPQPSTAQSHKPREKRPALGLRVPRSSETMSAAAHHTRQDN